MSKMDALRAMREAKFERGNRGTSATTARRPPVATPRGRVEATTPDEAPAADALCGHRNMSGRTCTREAGHSAKSHRYS